MKWRLELWWPLILGLGLLALVARGQSTNNIELWWPHDEQDVGGNNTYFIYAQTNVPPVKSAWRVFTNVSYHTWTNSGQAIHLPKPEGASRFFVVTRSNLFGETGFTMPVESRVLTAGTGVTIRVSARLK